MDKYQEVSEKIISTYHKRWDELGSMEKLHWTVRLYRISGKKEYKSKIDKLFKDAHKRDKVTLDSYESVSDAQKLGREIFRYKTKSSERSIRKKNFYKEHLDIYFYSRMMLYVFNIQSLGLSNRKECREKVNNFLKSMQDVDWVNIIFKSGLMENDPSQAINLAYYLKYCKVTDLEEMILNYFKDRTSTKPNGVVEWKDMIYGLNHIVIAATNYYQVFLVSPKYDFIREYYKKNLENILENTSLDVVSEMGVCLKLMGERGETLSLIKDFCISKFDTKMGYFLRDNEDNLGRAEHRNILTVMLLRDFQRLYEGPDLSI